MSEPVVDAVDTVLSLDDKSPPEKYIYVNVSKEVDLVYVYVGKTSTSDGRSSDRATKPHPRRNKQTEERINKPDHRIYFYSKNPEMLDVDDLEGNLIAVFCHFGTLHQKGSFCLLNHRPEKVGNVQGDPFVESFVTKFVVEMNKIPRFKNFFDGLEGYGKSDDLYFLLVSNRFSMLDSINGISLIFYTEEYTEECILLADKGENVYYLKKYGFEPLRLKTYTKQDGNYEFHYINISPFVYLEDSLCCKTIIVLPGARIPRDYPILDETASKQYRSLSLQLPCSPEVASSTRTTTKYLFFDTINTACKVLFGYKTKATKKDTMSVNRTKAYKKIKTLSEEVMKLTKLVENVPEDIADDVISQLRSFLFRTRLSLVWGSVHYLNPPEVAEYDKYFYSDDD